MNNGITAIGGTVFDANLKTCYECHIAKPLSDFYRCSKLADGHRNKCKTCCCVESRGYYSHRKEYYRRYARMPKTIAAKKRYAETAAAHASHRLGTANYLKRYPSKAAAHKACHDAIKRGSLKRRPCEICGAQFADAHHDDYSRPLDVRWLCPTHHREWHKHNKAKYPEEAMQNEQP